MAVQQEYQSDWQDISEDSLFRPELLVTPEDLVLIEGKNLPNN